MKFKGLLKVALLLVAVSALFVACDTLAGGKFPVMFEPYEPEEGYIYLKPNANWLEKDGSDVAPRFAVYTAPKDWSSADWYDMEETEKDSGIYKVKLPAEKKYHWVIFTRMNGSKAENNWDNKYNQSKDEVLVYADDDASNDKKVLYIVADGSWDNSSDSFWHNPEEYVGNTVKYTVTFTADSGVTGVPEKQEVKLNTQINAPADPAKEGYIFEGWYEGNTKITFPYTVTKDVTLTGKFTKVWKVTFASNPTGAKDLPAALTVADGEKVTKPTKDPSITAGTFKGWDFDFDKAITADTTITAKFEMNPDAKFYTVKWEGVEKADEKVVEGGTITKPADPTKAGSKFLGWYIGDKEVTFPYEVKSDVTITAKFSKEWKVTFKDCTLDPIAVVDGEKVTKPADLAKDGYKFDGWFNADGTAFDFDKAITADVTITAKFTLISTPASSTGVWSYTVPIDKISSAWGGKPEKAVFQIYLLSDEDVVAKSKDDELKLRKENIEIFTHEAGNFSIKNLEGVAATITATELTVFVDGDKINLAEGKKPYVVALASKENAPDDYCFTGWGETMKMTPEATYPTGLTENAAPAGTPEGMFLLTHINGVNGNWNAQQLTANAFEFTANSESVSFKFTNNGADWSGGESKALGETGTVYFNGGNDITVTGLTAGNKYKITLTVTDKDNATYVVTKA